MNSLNVKSAKAYFRLAIGSLFIYCFIFILVPCMLQSRFVKPIMNFVQTEEIDSGALFYTESPITGQVEFYMNKQNRKDTKEDK